jgi:two-component system chemotaxis response regulator CheB
MPPPIENDEGLAGSVRVREAFTDIIVIGLSAGGLTPLRQILADLPGDLQAAIFVVQHTGATSYLAEILDYRSGLPVQHARNGAPVVFGQVTVAVPDHHLLLHDGHLLLRRGPRENLSRPAIDPLFRSAAASYGGRVIGVVLSGILNDGTAGLRAIKRCGGVTLVQSPEDAAYPDMPNSALHHVAIDHIAPADKLGALLVHLVDQPAGPTPAIPFDVRLEATIAAQEVRGMEVEDKLGRPSRFTCPECHGALWEIDDGRLMRFRCHVGHAFTADAVLHAQAAQAEELLWNLLRTHRERAALAHRLATEALAAGHEANARDFAERAGRYAEDADIINEMLLERAAE